MGLIGGSDLWSGLGIFVDCDFDRGYFWGGVCCSGVGDFGGLGFCWWGYDVDGVWRRRLVFFFFFLEGIFFLFLVFSLFEKIFIIIKIEKKSGM